MITIQDIDKKLEALRDKWTLNIGDREILLRQARALEIAKERLKKKDKTVKNTY